MQKKAVLDTNVWVSYFINSRADYLIQWIVESSEIIFYTSTALAEELEEVLGRPKFKQQFPYLISDFIKLHLQVCELVKVPKQLSISPDPGDNFLFDLCKQVNADYLITSDKQLLNFTPPFSLEIITFNQLRTLYG
ncbi:MAG TPA: putative toxin-antitoxin system toxin component, PIN family [Ginsengibacter sp.]|nr:putative toxin-antitoxin system toxin component, PIN family [Ginsengibacter sp.]